MLVTLVSQCEKKALKRTRRVLDAFANRIGDNTWQTVITQEGLLATKKLLRKTASKNTAVACHWIRSRSRSDLVWVVGNKGKFNEQGIVPVNYTEGNFQVKESTWLAIQATSLMAAIAGLFHDVGKANDLFQRKLVEKNNKKNYEPYRHEWVSLRIFQAFVDESSDKQWLQKLATATNKLELETLQQLTESPEEKRPNPFTSLPPVARLVAWLIVSHHRLPASAKENPPSLSNIHCWHESFDVLWNSSNHCEDKQWSDKELAGNWQFSAGTPLISTTWQLKARSLGKQALSCSGLLDNENWFEDRFVAHLGRLSVMLADHYYSSKPKAFADWQDPNSKCYANTDNSGNIKQKLDEHNIAVGIYARRIACSLPQLRQQMPGLKSDKYLKKTVPAEHKEIFGWQDSAYKIALGLRPSCENCGFFGINMASTGRGKTRANARIMYALSETDNCRFSIALGLRTLTLQTGDALKEQLKINKEEIATLIGSIAVKQLHDMRQLSEADKANTYEQQGSESATPLMGDEVELKSQLTDYAEEMPEWFEHDKKLLRLIQAPVLVSTIDYLIPATEGVRGGRQIAPMLRLLTSDLVIDEPDDFDLEDMPALCRLVNWAGMLGCKVLFSTATMPPSFSKALFDAYQAGRQQFNRGTGLPNTQGTISCAWFDECTKPITENVSSADAFEQIHSTFVANRIKKLDEQGLALQKGKLLPLATTENQSATEVFAETIYQSIFDLHKQHKLQHISGKTVSLGLVRMANINPMVAVAKHLLSQPAHNDDCRVHYCVYHSQYPLVLRHLIEKQLDEALTRHDEEKWWIDSGIEECIEKCDEKNHLFVVLATPVAEVGRDHDYDWAIAEPSSMRSLIQLAGRVQRHRRVEPKIENIYILSSNRKGLKNISPAFAQPGFETKQFAYSSYDLATLLKSEHYQALSAKPRISLPLNISTQDGKFTDFVELEHYAQMVKLYGSKSVEVHAALWWQHPVSWSAELQAMQRFRKSQGNDIFCLRYSDRTDRLQWREKNLTARPPEYINTNRIKNFPNDLDIDSSNSFWGKFNTRIAVQNLIDDLKVDENKAWDVYTEVQLKATDSECWRFNEFLGVYKELED